MMQKLRMRFWIMVGGLALLVAIISQGPGLFMNSAKILSFTDELHTQEAHADVINSYSGLSVSVMERLSLFTAGLNLSSRHDWEKIYRDWYRETRHWFEKKYPGTSLYNRYLELWVEKREKIKAWRLSCREEFFSDLSDAELESKAVWLKDQEEWQEMQAKIIKGVGQVEDEYQKALENLLGPRVQELKKLESRFFKGHIKKLSAPAGFFL